MTRSKPTWRRLRWLFLAGALLLGLASFHTHLLPLLYHAAPGYWHAHEHRGAAVWLPDYHAVVQARPIEGVGRNLSGLTFNTETGTLFAAINRPARIVELATDGRLLRSITVQGVRDMESITHVEGTRFAVADERDSQLYLIELGAGSTEVRANPMGPLPIRSVHHNQGVEALFWDERNNRLLVGQERFPVRVLALDAQAGMAAAPSVDSARNWLRQGLWAWLIGDISGLTTHMPSGNLLVLSDQSAVLIEYAPDGEPISMLPLWRGLHGLERRVPQAEGVAMAPDGSLFVVSEPNLFYRFEKPALATLADVES